MKKLISITLLTTALFGFDLKPIKLNDNSYYIEGKKEYYSKENKGDIANSAFIITNNSVILIDTGSTTAYGEALIKTISKITKKPIKHVINTHHHPDHFLGNSAFTNSDIYASEFTKKEIEEHGELYVNNVVNHVGEAAYTTKSKAPNKILKEGKLILDDYELEVLHLDGHTKSDMVFFDKKAKILYASDLIFNQRALATPHANIQKWINSLEKLKKLDFEVLVPGHGKVSKGTKVIDENIKYLQFVEKSLINGINEGLDTFEILEKEVPAEFSNYDMFKEEFERSIINLYPKYESQL